MPGLILSNHRQSACNQTNRSRAWTDVDLTVQGMREAHEASHALQKEGLTSTDHRYVADDSNPPESHDYKRRDGGKRHRRSPHAHEGCHEDDK